MYIIVTGLSFVFIGTCLIVIAKQEFKKANVALSKAIVTNSQSTKLTEKFNYLTRTVAKRGTLIKQLKTELYKPKPKKEKKQVDGVFIKADDISNWEWKDGILKVYIIDTSVKHLNALSKLDKIS